MFSRRAAHLGLLLTIVVGGAACSDSAPDRSAASFADRYAAVGEAGFDGSDLAAVADRADDVVVGALTTLVRGPDVVAEGGGDIAPLASSVVLTIENTDGIHRVFVPRRVNDDIDDMALRAPIGARVVVMTVAVTLDDGTALDGPYSDPDDVSAMGELVHPNGLLVVEDGTARALFGTSGPLSASEPNLEMLRSLGLEVERIES